MMGMPLSRRNLLIGAGGIVAASGALVGTGAFTTVQAERTVSVETSGDQDALLALEPTSEPNGQEYAEINNDDLLEVDIPDVNLDAVTHIDNVFQVTNNGTQPVALYFQEQPPNTGNGNDNGNAIDLGAKTSELTNNSPNSAGGSDGISDSDVVDISNPSSPNYSNLGVKLGVGDTLWVGFYIDTSDDDLGDGLDADDSESSGADADELLMDGLVIYANAEEADNARFEAKSGNH